MLKVIKVTKENEDITAVEVHFYATNTHAFNGAYKWEMVVDKQICRKWKIKGTNINHQHTNLLKLEDVDILVYDSNLTKTGTLHFKTIDILKRLLPEGITLRWESTEPSCRSRRLLKPEMVGIHVDSDGALFDEREEYGPSSSTSNDSSKDIDYDGVLDPMDDFE